MFKKIISLGLAIFIASIITAYWDQELGKNLLGEHYQGAYGISYGKHWVNGAQEFITGSCIFLFFTFILFQLFYYKIFKNVKTIKEYSSDIVSASKDVINATSDLKPENTKFYNIAENEVDSGNIDRDLWSLALVKAHGNENLRKVEYIKLRVKQLKKLSK